MPNLLLSYRWLYWTRPSGPAEPTPDGIERNWVDTPGGSIEILSAQPKTPRGPPLFFMHGAQGSATVWTEYMQFFAAHGVACYAISVRGHGESWHPTFLRMIYFTTRRMIGDDLVAGIRWVQDREKSEVVLVGHSSGGGLAQDILSRGEVSVRGLVLLGAVPVFGSADVFKNWVELDPWFTIRVLLHFGHTNSPLSHPALTKAAFFSDGISDSYLLQFQRQMSRYESLLWPMSMTRPFADPATILGQVRGGAVLVMAGAEDKLMTGPVMERLAAVYRDAAKTRPEEAVGGGVGKMAELWFVPGAGHQAQNDVTWESGAIRLLEFWQALDV